MSTHLRELFKGRKFWPLFLTQFLGALNDNIFKNSLVMLITFKGISVFGATSSSLVAFSGGLFILPFFLFSATAGQLSDKLEKAKIIRWTKIWELFVMIFAAIGFYFNLYELLVVVLFFMGLQSTFFGPVKYSILPDLLSEKQLVSGNAYVELGTFLAILIGTILGGVVSALPDAELWIVAGILGVAILGIISSRLVPETGNTLESLKVDLNPIFPTGRIIKMAAEKKAVFNSILAISWFWFLGAAILSILPVYGKDVLHGDQNVVTAFLATFTIGIGAGSILCEKLSFERVEIGLVPLGSLGMSLFLIDLFFVVPDWSGLDVIIFSEFIKQSAGQRILFDFLMFSIFGGVFIVPLYTLIQQRSEKHVRSRIIAANNILNALFMVISAVLLMWLYSLKLSIQEIFLIFAGLNLIVAFYIYSVVPEFALRFISWILVRLMYRLKVKGHENIPKEGPAILVCNHQSFADWLVIAGGIKRPIHFIMYYKFMQIPLANIIMKHGKVIPIAGKNEDPQILEDAFKKMSQDLKDGDLICIFPEGEITRTGEINEFKRGVEKLLITDPVPVIPMALNGFWGSLFSYKGGRAFLKLPKRLWHRVSLTIGSPIPPEKVTAALLEKEVKALFGH